MNATASLYLNEKDIEKIQSRLSAVHHNLLNQSLATVAAPTFKEISLEETRTEERQQLHQQTVRLELNHRYELERLRVLALLNCAILTLQALLFYSGNPSEELLLNCISFLSLIALVVQIIYVIAASQLHKCCTWLTLLLLVLHPNNLTPQINTLLHLALVLRVGLLLEWRLKSLSEYKPQAARVLRFEQSHNESRVKLGLKALMKRISAAQTLFHYLFLNVLLAHCLYISLKSSPGFASYSFDSVFEFIVSTFTRVGWANCTDIDGDILNQAIFYATLVLGTILNGFLVFSSVAGFKMTTNQENAHRLLILLNVQQGIEVSSAQFLRESMRRHHNQDVRRNLYLKFLKDISKRRNCSASIRRSGMLEFLTCSYRSQLTQLAAKQRILDNMLKTVVRRLRRVRPKRTVFC